MAMALVGVLAAWGAAFAQEGGGGEPGKGPGGGQGGMRGQGGPMGELRGLFQSFRGLHGIMEKLDEGKKAKVEEAQKKMVDAVKKAQEQFEADLGTILSKEEMDAYTKAKNAPPPEGRWGGRGGDRSGKKRPGEGGGEPQ